MWQMDKELGADEDDGSFMEASPMEDSQADDEEDTSFPAAKTVSTGAHSCKAPQARRNCGAYNAIVGKIPRTL